MTAATAGFFSAKYRHSALYLQLSEIADNIGNNSSQSSTGAFTDMAMAATNISSAYQLAEQLFGRTPTNLELQLVDYVQKRLRTNNQPELVLREIENLLRKAPQHALTLIHHWLNQLDKRALQQTLQPAELKLKDGLEALKKTSDKKADFRPSTTPTPFSMRPRITPY